MATENIITGAFRLAFPEVFTPKASQDGGKEKYSITMLFGSDPLLGSLDGEGVMALRRLAMAAIKEKWGEDKAKWPANFRNIDPKTYMSPNGKDGWPFRDGNMVEWNGFAGTTFVRASSQFPPGIVDAKRQAVIAKDQVFGGLICRAQINAYAYDTNGNRGVTFGLSNLQILKDDGTTFGGRSDASDVFDAFGDAGAADANDAW